MKHPNLADAIVHRTALEQYLTESNADSPLAATTEIVQCGDAGGASAQWVGVGLSLEHSDGASGTPEREPLEPSSNAKPRRSSARPAARPERYDVAHDQLYDYVDQRARRLVRIDERQFDGLASTSR